MADQNNRSNFLFGLTLTELAFILFFILLFFSTLVVKEKDKLSKELTQIKEKLDEFKEEIETYKKVFEEISDFKEKTIEEKSKWLKELVEKDDLDAKNHELNKKLTKIKEKLDKFKEEIKLKDKQVTSLEKKIKGLAGNRHPACWKDKNSKKPEYIYDIILGENGITTHRGYKKYLEEEFQKIPESQNIIGTKNISIREFKQKTRSVFNWSVHTAKPECRHFVRIFDETSSKETYKIPLRGIENYFFKKEYKMTYSEFKEISASPIGSIIRDKKN